MIKSLKNLLVVSLISVASLSFVGCDRVQPNEIGVLVQNYGKDPAKDYTITAGKVVTASPGTTLYKLPAYEQRSQFEKPIVNKSSDGTEFSVTPRYSYRINPEQATRVVREHSKVFNEGNDLKEVERRSLDPAVTDVVRDIIGKTTSGELMNAGGNTKFNEDTRRKITQAFAERGFTLLSFSTVLDYSSSVKSSIDARNRANSEISTLDSKILQAEKQAKLAEIEAKTSVVTGEAITDQELQKALIAKWDGQLPSTYICDDKNKSPLNLVLNNK